MRKLSARWVPRLLIVDQKHTRRTLSRTNLNLFEEDPANFLKRFVTMDETWVHHFTPGAKQQSKQWKHPGSAPPKKAKTVPSAGKVMASVFWDADGILLIDYLQKGQTINGTYYASLLTQLREKIKIKRRGKLTKGVLFHQDNAPVHKSVIAMAAIHNCGFKLIEHPPYSLDLAPSDFHLFPKLKTAISGTHFQSNDDVIHAADDFLNGQEKDFLKVALRLLNTAGKSVWILKGIMLKNIATGSPKFISFNTRLTTYQSALVLCGLQVLSIWTNLKLCRLAKSKEINVYYMILTFDNTEKEGF